jgi:hypothetical protein
MFDTLYQKFKFKGIEIKDQMCEDMTNKEEFLHESHESMEHTMTDPSTIIPHQCGNLSVDEYSSLSKTQKKKLKAKSKGKSINKGVKSESKEHTSSKEPISIDLPKMNLDDPLIAKVQSIIEHELKIDKLSEEEISSIVDVVNGENIPD